MNVWRWKLQNCLARSFPGNVKVWKWKFESVNFKIFWPDLFLEIYFCNICQDNLEICAVVWFRHGDDMVTLWWKYDDGLICYHDFMMMLWWLYDASRMMLWRLNDEDMMILHGTAQPRLPPSLAMSWIRLHHVRCSPVKKMLTYQMQLHFTNKLLLDINSCSLLTCNFVLTFSPILYFYKWFSRKKP